MLAMTRKVLGAAAVVVSVGCGSATAQVTETPGASPAGAPAVVGVRTSPIGAGVEALADWSRSMAFVDMVKQSRTFGSAEAPYDGTAPVDGDGWPTADFGAVLFTGMRGIKGTGGVYRLSCTCNALPDIRALSSPAQVVNVARDTATGRVTADILFTEGGEQLFISLRNTGGGVKDLRVSRPGYGPEDLFTAPFLDHLARFGTIRFMNWSATNGSTVREWTDRARPEMARYTGPGGVPWEVCAQLCNRLHADMWINVPHMASDDYVRNLAVLLKGALDPDRKLYLEYSNEVWNFSFKQAQWNQAEAVAEVHAGDSVLKYDGETNEYYWGWRRTAKRSKEISDVFRGVFAEPRLGGRLRPVLAGQMGNTEVLKQGLRMAGAAYGPPRNYFYALAGAPYFNLGAADQRTDLTVDEVIAAMEASVAALPSEFAYEKHLVMARWLGLEFLGYEGGPDTFGPNNVPAKLAANLDPRMVGVCRRFLTDWYSAGFGELSWYVAGATNWDSPYGTWGLTYDMAVQKAPKIEAIDLVRRMVPTAITAGDAVPGDVDARHFVGAPADWATRDPYLRTPQANTSKDYLVRADAAGGYEVRVETASGGGGGMVQLLVNSRPLRVLSAPATGGWEKWGTTHPVTVELEAGLSVVRLFFVNDQAYNVKKLVFSRPGSP